MQPIVTPATQRSAVGRRIEPASRARNHMVTFEPDATPASLTTPAITPKYMGPQPPAQRRVLPECGGPPISTSLFPHAKSRLPGA